MAYSVRKADIEADKYSIIEFWNKNHKSTIDEKYKWIYENNPDGIASVWLLIHDESMTIVGMASLFPRLFCNSDKSYKVGIQGDLLVDSNHRSLGPVFSLLKTLLISDEAKSCSFLYSFPNKNADLVFKRLGYSYIGSIVRRVRLYDSKRLLREAGLPSIFAAFIGPVVNILNTLMAPEFWYYDFQRHEIKIQKYVSDEYSLLWEKAKSNGFSTCKSREYMNWKYKTDPDEENGFFTVYKRDTREMVGCIVYSQTENVIEIRDIVYKDSLYSRISLVSLFLNYARKQNIESIYFLSVRGALLDRDLSSFDFIDRGKGKPIYTLINNDSPVVDEICRLLRPDKLILLKTDQDT